MSGSTMDRWVDRAWSNIMGVFGRSTLSPAPTVPLARRASASQSPSISCTDPRCRRSMPSSSHSRRPHSRNTSTPMPSSLIQLPRCDEFQTLRTYDIDRSVHHARRYPRFTFVMDEHPIRSLEPTIGPTTGTLLHLVAHLVEQVDRAITAGEITTTDHGRNWINRLHAQILVSLHGPSPLGNGPSSAAAVRDIHTALQAQLDSRDIVLVAIWQDWYALEWRRILHLASMSKPPSLSALPPTRPKKLLVLDLDRTLWFRSYRPFDTADFVAVYQLPQTQVTSSIYVSIRPGAQFLLDSVAPFYDIAVFTASDRKCTDDLVDLLDVKRLIQYRLYRDICTTDTTNTNVLRKDLSVTGRPVTDVIVVDDNPIAWTGWLANTVVCKPYIGSNRDVEMYSLTHKLLALYDVADVRVHVAPLSTSTSQVA